MESTIILSLSDILHKILQFGTFLIGTCLLGTVVLSRAIETDPSMSKFPNRTLLINDSVISSFMVVVIDRKRTKVIFLGLTLVGVRLCCPRDSRTDGVNVGVSLFYKGRRMVSPRGFCPLVLITSVPSREPLS